MKLLSTILVLALAACAGAPPRPDGPPPTDPLAGVEHAELFGRGLAFARAGDYLRAEQYLQTALLKGHPEQEVVPALVKVCVAASRLRAALAYAAPYLEQHPDDAAMRYLTAHLRLAAGDRDGARRELETLRTTRPAMGEATLSLALLVRDDGDAARARALLGTYLAAEPTGPDARTARAALAALPPEDAP